jgi:prophage regulatory protein
MQPVVVPDDEAPAPRLIFKAEVIKRTGFSYPSLWKWMRAGTFPMSFVVGNKTAWAEHEIDAWLASRPRSNLKRNES